MLRARSVAVVGASERPGTVGAQTMRQLIGGGFDGPVYPVNPGYDTIHGIPAVASLEDLAEGVDLVVLAVANHALESEMEKVVRTGSRSAAIFASCHGAARDGHSLRDRLVALADDAGIPICGGNGMGFLNLEERLRVCGFYQPLDLRPGSISFLSHSGSMFSAVLHNRRGLDLNLAVSTGLELNTTMDRYLDWVLDLESTRVVALFLETVRDPEGLIKALARAEAADIPVVALKVGVSGQGREAVLTHSGALAGEDSVYDAVFEAHGVHRVETMDEMADTVELLWRGRKATAQGLGAVHDSGGERALLIDIAGRVGVPLPQLGEAAVERLRGLLDPGLEPQNPVDAWGTGHDTTKLLTDVMTTLADDERVGAVAFCVDLTAEEAPDDAYSTAAIEAASLTTKPVMVIANVTTTVDPVQARSLRDRGVPVLEGTETALRAVSHLFARKARGDLPPMAPRETAPDPSPDDRRLLAHYGIPTPRAVTIRDEGELIAAGDTVGFPVVLKTSAVGHKTEVAGVVLGLRDRAQLTEAYTEMRGRLGPVAIVCEQIEAGVEIGVGMTTDSQFGPIVVISAGGTLIELLDDKVALLPRVDRVRARRALDRLAIAPLLHGHRGSPPVDIEAITGLIARFSEMVVDLGSDVASIDLNPVICGPDGAVAVDVLMVRR